MNASELLKESYLRNQIMPQETTTKFQGIMPLVCAKDGVEMICEPGWDVEGG